MYPEYKFKEGKLWCSCGPTGHACRDYDMFGLLCEGVRRTYDEKYGDVALLPNGFPEDASYRTIFDYYYTINDEGAEKGWCGCISSENAKKIKEEYKYDEFEAYDKKLIRNPNFYGASYITLEEFREVLDNYSRINGYDPHIEYEALYQYLKTFNDKGLYDVRLVYWFDS